MSASPHEELDAVDPTTRLVDEFRSRLDESLILAIAGDLDLTSSSDWDIARTSLLQLAEHAVLEELSGFNHSGVASADIQDGLERIDLNGDDCGSATEISQSQTLDSGLSGPTASLSGFSDDSDLSLFLNTESWSDDRKKVELCAMFPMLTELDITLALRKNGDFGKAVDDLLNIQGLEEAGLRQKGIDGFFNPEDTYGWGFSKGKKKKYKSETAENGKQRVAVDYRLKPLPKDEDEDEVVSAKYRAQPGPSRPPQLLLPSRQVSSAASHSPRAPVKSPTGWQTVEPKRKPQTARKETRTETALSARSEARAGYAAASQAARKGNLYRAYAGISAERAAEATRDAQALEFQDWNAHVDSHNNTHGNTIDLHGVPVLEGVRIALQRTANWWASFDEDRVQKARQNHFTIITGMGNHSVNGVSRLRQHVWAALERHGWKANTYDGLFVVTGKR